MFSVMSHCLCFSCLRPSKKDHQSESEELVVSVLKLDGKILEYKTSVLVKDVLASFIGCGISVTQKLSQYLPPDYELKLGHFYYLLPLDHPGSDHGVKRIKVVISKQQLQDLLSKKATLEELLLSSVLTSAGGNQLRISTWRPVLETIFEGSER